MVFTRLTVPQRVCHQCPCPQLTRLQETLQDQQLWRLRNSRARCQESQCLTRVLVSSQLSSHCMVTWRGKGAPCGLFYNSTNLIQEAPSSWPIQPPEAPLPNTTTRGIRFQHMNLGDTHNLQQGGIVLCSFVWPHYTTLCLTCNRRSVHIHWIWGMNASMNEFVNKGINGSEKYIYNFSKVYFASDTIGMLWFPGVLSFLYEFSILFFSQLL